MNGQLIELTLRTVPESVFLWCKGKAGRFSDLAKYSLGSLGNLGSKMEGN